MKLAKAFLVTTIVLILLLGVFIIYQQHYSTYARIGKWNEANLSRIKTGMSLDEVKAIMGEGTHSYIRNGVLHYTYPASNDDYMEIDILFDSSGKVINVFNPSSPPYWLKD